MRTPPDFSHETTLLNAGLQRIAGVDEAGRGPLAGPVVAAAVILDPDRIPDGIDDSKRLRPAARDRLDRLIRESAEWGLGLVEADEIDRLGIARASLLAMERAVGALACAPDHVLIDGPWRPAHLPCPARPVVGGDRLSLSIAAASIVAKSWRDRIMVALAQQHPGYGWERNKGYGSESHIAALHRLGPSPAHRRSFAPLRHMLCPEGATCRP